MRYPLSVLMVLLLTVATMNAQESAVSTFSEAVDGICHIPEHLHKLERLGVARIAYAVEDLCDTAPDEPEFRDGSAARWLERADQWAERLALLVFEEVDDPTSDQKTNAYLAYYAYTFQRNLDRLRWLAYAAVRIEVKEVIREFPAPCPEPQNPCDRALRSAANNWADRIGEWISTYQGSGDDWQLAKSSILPLRRLATEKEYGDPVSYVVGWLAQWHEIERRKDFSVLGPGPLPYIAKDMQAQLSLCGIHLPHRRR